MKLRAPSQVLLIVCMIAWAAFAQGNTEPQTESEFTGNPIVDEADAGNVTNDAQASTAGLASADDADSTDNEPEMSQEEADAELAADMNSADSAKVDTLQKLSLDMTTAFVPSASRRISAPTANRSKTSARSAARSWLNKVLKTTAVRAHAVAARPKRIRAHASSAAFCTRPVTKNGK